ncbi:uncharacterized protein LOC142344077 [Convolutriloba macropyga]|uniref:uncharacterized protein LOC142344077 n=1 Tax=Convolutriloba macropyga TaxID=536237 RepID=UPI003F51C06A
MLSLLVIASCLGAALTTRPPRTPNVNSSPDDLKEFHAYEKEAMGIIEPTEPAATTAAATTVATTEMPTTPEMEAATVAMMKAAPPMMMPAAMEPVAEPMMESTMESTMETTMPMMAEEPVMTTAAPKMMPMGMMRTKMSRTMM